MNHRVRLFVTLACIGSGGLSAGCRGTLYRQTGKVMSGYTVEHMVPALMSDDDVGMACETGVSMGGFLMSFERVTDVPEQAGSVTMLSAAMCAEAEAWEAELRGLRALHEGRATAAQDARIAEKRAHSLAARRFLRAFELSEAAFGEVGGACPKLDEGEGAFYLLGLSAGLLALIHDRAAEGEAGVPMDIPAKVIRAADCIEDAKWWGAPGALKAALWTSVPGSAPEGTDPWAALDTAAATGEIAGVRLARAFQVQAAGATGRDDLLRTKVTAHAASLVEQPSNPEWKLLDRYATHLILHESDRIWTKNSGHRTPLGALGEFPGASEEPVDDSLLEGLEDE
ncbi:MAG: hypothetical protein P1V51_21420 [Deltaproteobacteria bacterium]|nr:hypothetical protein [Deltaproteobacteria bacterium]